MQKKKKQRGGGKPGEIGQKMHNIVCNILQSKTGKEARDNKHGGLRLRGTGLDPPTTDSKIHIIRTQSNLLSLFTISYARLCE